MTTHHSRLGIDLNPNPVVARPQLDQRHRAVFWAGLLMIAGLGVFSLLNYVSTQQAGRDAAVARTENRELKDQRRMIKRTVRQAMVDRNRAERMGRWLTTALNTQPFVLDCLTDVPKDVTVQSFTMKMTEGQANVDSVEIVFLGDVKAISVHIDRMVSRLLDAGVLVRSPDPVPTTGGLRFKGSFIFPPANEIRWH